MKNNSHALLALLLTAACLSGCGRKEPAPADTAAANLPPTVQRALDSTQSAIDAQKAARTIKEMYVLAQARDWPTYVDRYYGEALKFSSASDRDILIERFRSEWGADVIAALELAATIKPEIVGDVALFLRDGAPVFTLHRDANGDWKFHL